jgi:RNA polymerase sigma-70 factor (ECF subfamily)
MQYILFFRVYLERVAKIEERELMFNWDNLVFNEGDKILNYVNKIVGELDNSKDIVQETFLACYQNLDRIDDEFLVPWLYRTAHNKAINFLKRNKRLVFGKIPEIVHNDSVEDDIKQEKLRRYIQSCFRKLKPKHAMVLDLQFYQKKSYKEISEITGMSVSAIESILVRAKKECKKIMQGFKDLDVMF